MRVTAQIRPAVRAYEDREGSARPKLKLSQPSRIGSERQCSFNVFHDSRLGGFSEAVQDEPFLANICAIDKACGRFNNLLVVFFR